MKKFGDCLLQDMEEEGVDQQGGKMSMCHSGTMNHTEKETRQANGIEEEL